MIICGIQSYSLNCSQKEQGGSSSLHVRMYAQVLAPCSNCAGRPCLDVGVMHNRTIPHDCCCFLLFPLADQQLLLAQNLHKKS